MVVMLLGSGFEESEAVVPLDLLLRSGVEAVTAGLDGRQVVSSHGLSVTADTELRQIEPQKVELLILPGGLGGVNAISACPAALELVRQVHSQGGRLAAICAAPTILAKLGLLEGRQAVCYPGMEDQMEGALVQKGTPVVTDGTIITGEAAGSAFQFGLCLVEALRGPEKAAEVKQSVHCHF
ncbi:MAG: DJ-1/PfpI family protein [Oscillospiraceae bacterium]|nr:DJ-1/PfpI family protein [Oscillospiraceae bacterium]